MCTLQPEWEIPAALQPQPILFQSTSFSKPQYKPTHHNNGHSPPEDEDWNPEPEFQESDNDGEMLSLTGFSPADSNNHDQLENDGRRKPVSRPLLPRVGKIKCISDLECHYSETGFGYRPEMSALQHRFVSYRPILVSDSSGWHAFAFSYFEIFLHSPSHIQMDEEIARISSLNNLLKKAGQYEIGLIQDTINETINLLKDLSAFKDRSPNMASDSLLRRFSDPDVSTAIICHFRLIASSWLAAKSTTYESYIPEGLGINTYRNRWLNAPHKEIDALGMTLLVDVLLRPLGVGFEVTSIGENETKTHCSYPKISAALKDRDSSTKSTTIHLLHRPNHYDILYADVHAGNEEEPNDVSDPQATLQATTTDLDAYSWKKSYQIPGTSFVRDLDTFTPQKTDVLPHLANLRISESNVNSIPGLNELGCVLYVHTAVSPGSFEPEKAPLTGLGDITAFAKDQEQEEAILTARRSRLRETEPKVPCSPPPNAKESRSFARESILPQGHTTGVEQSRSKHAEHVPPNTESPNIPVADSKNIANSSVEESMESHNESGTEYETDWEEEEEEEETGDEETTGASCGHGSIGMLCHLRERCSMKSVLRGVKDVLVKCLMEEFWDMTNQTLISNVRTHGSPQDSSTPPSENNANLRKSISHSTPGKRPWEDGNGDPPEQDQEGGSKKPKSALTSLEISGEILHFACPYRKHDPRKYNVNQWPACALTPQKGVARVKSHLYQKHRIHQCQRCKSLFRTQQELDIHIVAPEGCDVRTSNPEQVVEGITDRLRDQLKCRKKLYSGQTEAERWQQVYQLLFPDEIVPSPYFEPVRDLEDDQSQTPDSVRLEKHLRREVPRIFRILLDTEVDNELQSLEERLKSRLLGLLEEAQNRALTNYYSTSQVDVVTLSGSPFVERQRSSLETSSMSVPNGTSESIYQPWSAEVQVERHLARSDGVREPKGSQHHSSFDSGCYPESWTVERSQEITTDIPADTSLVVEPVRLASVREPAQLQRAGSSDSQHDEVWPIYPDTITMYDPLNLQAFSAWS